MKFELIDEDSSESIEPRMLLKTVLRAWPLFVLCGLMLLLVAGLFHTYFPPIYEAGISIHVENPNGNTNSSNLVVEPRLRADVERNYYINEEVRIGSYDLMLEGLRNLEYHVFYYQKNLLYQHIYNDAPFVVEIKNPLALERNRVPYNEPISMLCENNGIRLFCEGELANGTEWNFNEQVAWGDWIRLGSAEVRITQKNNFSEQDFCSEDFGFMLLDIEEQALELSDALEVSQGKLDASVYDLSLSGSPENFILDVLDAVANAYQNREDENQGKVHRLAVEHINAQLKLVKSELANTELSIERYKAQNSVTSLSHEGSLLLDQGFKLSDELSSAELKGQYYAKLSEILMNGAANAEPISPEAFGIEDRLLTSLTSEWVELLREKRAMQRQGNTANPTFERVSVALVDLKQQVGESLEGIRENNRIQQEELRKLASKNEREARKIPVKEKQLLEYERVYRSQENHYQTLTSRLAEASIALEASTSNVTVYEASHLLDFDPFLPDPLITLVGLVILTLVLPMLFLIIRGLFGNKLVSSEALRKLFHGMQIFTFSHHAFTNQISVKEYQDSKYADELLTLAGHLRRNQLQSVLFISVRSSQTKQLVMDLADLLLLNGINCSLLPNAHEQSVNATIDKGDAQFWLIPSIRKRAAFNALAEKSDACFFVVERNSTRLGDLDLIAESIQSEAKHQYLIYTDSLEENQEKGLWENEPRSVFWKLKRILKKA